MKCIWDNFILLPTRIMMVWMNSLAVGCQCRYCSAVITSCNHVSNALSKGRDLCVYLLAVAECCIWKPSRFRICLYSSEWQLMTMLHREHSVWTWTQAAWHCAGRCPTQSTSGATSSTSPSLNATATLPPQPRWALLCPYLHHALTYEAWCIL